MTLLRYALLIVVLLSEVYMSDCESDERSDVFSLHAEQSRWMERLGAQV